MARVLLLGGLDPSGGAGITVDATVVSRLGGEPLPIALATTVQGLRGFVQSHAIDAQVVREQVATVCADGPVTAVKVGYTGSADVVALVASLLEPLRGKAMICIDPVLSATAGGMAADAELVTAYRELLIPLATLVTPNTPELELLAAGSARALLDRGAVAVLHKGGHGEGAESIDELWRRESSVEPTPDKSSPDKPYREVRDRLVRQRFACGPVRGTGCALASAIATHLANNQPLLDACRTAGDWLNAQLSRVAPRPSGLPRHLPLTR